MSVIVYSSKESIVRQFTIFTALYLSAGAYLTAINVSIYMFPNYGSGYDPFITFIILAIATSIIIFLWGSETLAQYRYVSPHLIKEE